MLVRDLMDKNIAVCTEDMPLELLYKLMEEKGCDHVIVVDSYVHKIPIGIVTEHNICVQVVGKGRNPRGMTAANVMSTNFVKARIDRQANPVRQSSDPQTSYTVAVDENGSLCGEIGPARADSERAPAAGFNAVPVPTINLVDRIF
jgi:predicted transcriptional regulator